MKVMVMLQNACENCLGILEEEKHHQLRMFVILETDILIDKPKREKPKTVLALENIAVVYVKRHQYQFTVVLNN